MSVEALVEKLRRMRRAGPAKRPGDQGHTVMTTLFGLLFHEEIGSQTNKIARRYDERRLDPKESPGKWPGEGNRTAIRAGIRLAPFVEPHPAVRQKWKTAADVSGADPDEATAHAQNKPARP